MNKLTVVPFRKSDEGEWDRAQVIARLEEALQHARESDVRSIAIVAIVENEGVLDCWHNGGQPYVMLGAIESLKVDFLHACIERR